MAYLGLRRNRLHKCEGLLLDRLPAWKYLCPLAVPLTDRLFYALVMTLGLESGRFTLPVEMFLESILPMHLQSISNGTILLPSRIVWRLTSRIRFTKTENPTSGISPEE